MATQRSASAASRRPAVKSKSAKAQPRTRTPVVSRPRKTTASVRMAQPPVLGSAGLATQDGMERSLKHLLSIEAEVGELVRQAVRRNLDPKAGAAGVKQLITVVRDVVAGAIQATERAGTGLSVSIKGVARGVAMGAHDVRSDICKAASETVRLAVRHGSKVRADVDLVVRRALDGIVEAVSETGGDVAQVAKTVAAEARRAARRAGKPDADSSHAAGGTLGDGRAHMRKSRSAGPGRNEVKRSVRSAAG